MNGLFSSKWVGSTNEHGQGKVGRYSSLATFTLSLTIGTEFKLKELVTELSLVANVVSHIEITRTHDAPISKVSDG